MSSESNRCYYPLLFQPVRHKPVEVAEIPCAGVMVTEASYLAIHLIEKEIVIEF